MALLEALVAALCSEQAAAGAAAAPAADTPPAPAAAGASRAQPSSGTGAAASSGALREIAARLVGEFLDWSARHVGVGVAGGAASAAAEASRNFNATSLLRRLFDRLAHPRAEARLGAAHGMVHCARWGGAAGVRARRSQRAAARGPRIKCFARPLAWCSVHLALMARATLQRGYL